MISENVCVAIPFVRVDPSQNPNLSVKAGEDPIRAYYRSMVVAFASVRRFNPDAILWLITNEFVSSPYREQLQQLGVHFKIEEFQHLPSVDFTKRFAASLYLIDSLNALTQKTTILIDPDVLCIRPLDDMISQTSGAAGVLPINYAADHDVNGLSRRQAGELHGVLGEPQEAPIHYGGEVYILPLDLLPTIRIRCERAWNLAIQRNREGETKFHTEEHILSFALRGVQTVSLEQFVRRIWTAHRLRQVSGRENELTLWHLPAEKDRGFARLYSSSIDPESWFWTSRNTDFVKICGQAMGLHNRSLKRFALDFAGQTLHWLRSRLTRPGAR
jgi:hypothetical protein